MERMLFAQALVSSAAAPRRGAVMPVSVALHALAMAALLTVSALTPETLPVVDVQQRVAVDWIPVTPPVTAVVGSRGTTRPAVARPPRARTEIPA